MPRMIINTIIIKIRLFYLISLIFFSKNWFSKIIKTSNYDFKNNFLCRIVSIRTLTCDCLTNKFRAIVVYYPYNNFRQIDFTRIIIQNTQSFSVKSLLAPSIRNVMSNVTIIKRKHNYLTFIFKSMNKYHAKK